MLSGGFLNGFLREPHAFDFSWLKTLPIFLVLALHLQVGTDADPQGSFHQVQQHRRSPLVQTLVLLQCRNLALGLDFIQIVVQRQRLDRELRHPHELIFEVEAQVALIGRRVGGGGIEHQLHAHGLLPGDVRTRGELVARLPGHEIHFADERVVQFDLAKGERVLEEPFLDMA